ncbi:MAG: hydroxymethylbilane synthase [Flavobacteriaceae bacterium]
MIRIGTRKSALAIWQAEKVQSQLMVLGYACDLVPIESSGDQNLTQPLYKMGIQGVFTKALDSALLDNRIDIAVHSLKDVPTMLPKGIQIAAVLERDSAQDVIVCHPSFKVWGKKDTIGSGSLRRRAQWLRKYPSHQVENLRGNLQKRFEKLEQSNWSGAIFAEAGLERLGLIPEKFERLDWMIPAPAQGIIGIASLEERNELNTILKKIHQPQVGVCADIERNFLNTLEGGCTAPIGAYARVKNDQVFFEGGLFSLDGTQALIEKNEIPLKLAKDFGKKMAIDILNRGGKESMHQIKSEL